MASAQEPGLVKLYIETPSGNRYNILTRRVEETGPSGSADHAVQSTPEKWVYIPVGGSLINRGDKVILSVISDGADTTDGSDCVASIPFVHAGTGQPKTVTDADLSIGDVALAASVETQIGSYEFKGGPYRFGGGKLFLSVEDDTA